MYGTIPFRAVVAGTGIRTEGQQGWFQGHHNFQSVPLAVATTRTQDVQLSVGTITQTVEVKSEGSVSLDTTDATIGNNFDLRAVSSLPNEFRGDVANLLRLQPGVVSADSQNNVDDNGGSQDKRAPSLGPVPTRTISPLTGIDASDFGVGQAFHSVAAIPVGRHSGISHRGC